MIAYLDTSTLVKLYVDEPGSAQAAALVEKADIVATSRVAYVEAIAAFSRRRAELEAVKTLGQLRRELERDWPNYFAIEVSENVMRLAADLAEKHALRGFNSLHLASALFLRNRIPAGQVIFSSSDKKLNEAAEKEGFQGYS